MTAVSVTDTIITIGQIVSLIGILLSLIGIVVVVVNYWRKPKTVPIVSSEPQEGVWPPPPRPRDEL